MLALESCTVITLPTICSGLAVGTRKSKRCAFVGVEQHGSYLQAKSNYAHLLVLLLLLRLLVPRAG